MPKLLSHVVTDCECSSKHITLFPFVGLTTQGHWELTDVRENEEISVDFEERLQTLPDKVSITPLFNAKQYFSHLFFSTKLNEIELLLTTVPSL